MEFPQEQITELKGYFGVVEQGEEAGLTYFLIPKFKLPEGCTPTECDVLLSPMPANGYDSRLYFAERIQQAKIPNLYLNWNATDVRILDRNWHAFSWKLTKPNLRLAELVLLHLKPLQV